MKDLNLFQAFFLRYKMQLLILFCIYDKPLLSKYRLIQLLPMTTFRSVVHAYMMEFIFND